MSVIASAGTKTTEPESEYSKSADALAILGVKPQTLYSYVSRGLIRRICVDGKTSLYHREDIRRLKARSAARSGHGAVAGAALQWGEPVLMTALTEITADGPRYRKHLAVDLARDGYSFESVAEYFWSNAPLKHDTSWDVDDAILHFSPQIEKLTEAYPRLHLRQLLTEIVLLMCIEQEPCQKHILKHSLKPARVLVQALSTAFGFFGPQRRFVVPRRRESVANYILRASGIDATGEQQRALNSALILLLDHEFSPPAFTARIAASSGADLYSSIGAALQVHFGSRLALRCDRVEQALAATLAGVQSNKSPAQSVEPVGFSHPLYAEGDPRAAEILQLALGLREHERVCSEALTILRDVDGQQCEVGLESALILLCRALGLEGAVASGVLAVSRSAGWVAQVIEQYEQDFMIRPRGKFSPSDESAQ
jgi:citrate synthase